MDAYATALDLVRVGLVIALAFALNLAKNRRSVAASLPHSGWSLVKGLCLVVIVALMLKSSIVREVILTIARIGNGANAAATDGFRLVFGTLAERHPEDGSIIFATRVLPAVIYFSALMGVLYYVGLMQLITRAMARALTAILGDSVSAPEAVAAAANLVAGQTEAPLAIRPYIEKMSDSGLIALMTCGFATISAPLTFVYGQMLSDRDASIDALYLSVFLQASILSIPAALFVAKIVEPNGPAPTPQAAPLQESLDEQPTSLVSALAQGSRSGAILAVNIAAILIAIGALIKLVDYILRDFVGIWLAPAVNWIAKLVAGSPSLLSPDAISLESILSVICLPFAWLIGIDSCEEIWSVARLMGLEFIGTEFMAFQELSQLVAVRDGSGSISLRSTTLAIFALCGFASLPSIGVQVGALSGIAPSRRADVARLVPWAMAAGLVANWLTASTMNLMTMDAHWEEGQPVTVGFAEERPFAFRDDDGNVRGISIEIIRTAFPRVRLKEVEFDHLIVRLEQGDIDLIATGMFITPSRCRVISFSNPTFSVQRGLLIAPFGADRLDASIDPYQVVREARLRLGVVDGGVSQQDARDAHVPASRTKAFETLEKAVAAFKAGEIDAVGGSMSSLHELYPESDDGKVVSIHGDRKKLNAGIGFRKGDTALRAELNRVVQLGRDAGLPHGIPNGISIPTDSEEGC